MDSLKSVQDENFPKLSDTEQPNIQKDLLTTKEEYPIIEEEYPTSEKEEYPVIENSGPPTLNVPIEDFPITSDDDNDENNNMQIVDDEEDNRQRKEEQRNFHIFGSNAKVLDNPFECQIRKTVEKYPKNFEIFVQDIRVTDEIPYSVKKYNTRDFFGRTEPITRTLANKESGLEKTKCLVYGVDSDGTTVVIQVENSEINLLFTVPDDWDKSICNDFVERIKDRVSNRFNRNISSYVTFKQRKMFQYYGFVQEDKDKKSKNDPIKTKKWNVVDIRFPNVQTMKFVSNIFISTWQKKYNNTIQLPGIGDVKKFVKVHEYNISSEMKVKESLGLVPGGWIKIHHSKQVSKFLAHSQVELAVDKNDIEINNEKNDIPPFVRAIWDIEQYDKSRRFPNPFNINDNLICIGTNVHQKGVQTNYCFFVHKNIEESKLNVHGFYRMQIENITVFVYKDELKCCEGWRDFMVMVVNADYTLAFNQRKYDWSVLVYRILLHNAIKYYKLAPEKLKERIQKIDTDDQFAYAQTKIKKYERIRSDKKNNNPESKELAFRKIVGWVLRSIYEGELLQDPNKRTNNIKKNSKKTEEEKYDPFNRTFGFKDGDTDAFHLRSNSGSIRGIDSRFFYFGRCFSERTPYVRKIMKTGNLGDNLYKFIEPTGGMGDIDIHHYAKTLPQKFDSYTLKDLTKAIVKDSDIEKYDLPYNVLFEKYAKDDFKEIIIYTEKDCECPDRIFSKCEGESGMIEMARTSYALFSEINTKGVQVRTYCYIVRLCSMYVFFINIPENLIKNVDGFKGGSVKETLRGYYDVYIMIIDVLSLYPSVMKKNCLCPSTLIQNLNDLKDIDSSMYNTFTTENGTWHFMKADGKNIICINAILVKNLKALRASIKEEMKKLLPGDPKIAIFSQREKAIKLLLNGTYGFFAVGCGYIPCLQVGDSITCAGRQVIQKAEEMLLEQKNPNIPCLPISDSVTRAGEQVVKKAEEMLVEQKKTNILVIGGDTDSLFVGLMDIKVENEKTMEQAFTVGQKLCDMVNTMDPTNDVMFQLEGISKRGLFFTKKRYYIYLYESMNTVKNPPKLIAKGVESKKRDNAGYVRKSQESLARKVLVEEKPEEAVESAFEKLKKLEAKDIGPEDFNEFIITKELKSDYSKSRCKPIHVHVRDKNEARAKGSGQKSGDRVKYVVIEAPKANYKYEQGEDADYARQNPKKCKIDRLYYLERFKKPVIDILDLLYENVDTLFDTVKNNIAKQQSNISNVFGASTNTFALSRLKKRDYTKPYNGTGGNGNNKKITKQQTLSKFLPAEKRGRLEEKIKKSEDEQKSKKRKKSKSAVPVKKDSNVSLLSFFTKTSNPQQQ